nr:LruC domain-containing protein [Vibrio agarilyticus]
MANATAFDSCPSKAYLFQSKPVQVYGVNLVTGSTTLLQNDTGLNANINGVGFNFDDRYIYGYNTTHKQIVRLGQDFIAETLNVTGLPDHTFFVGDVYNHTYYLYRHKKGLFKIDLSPLDSDPSATLVIEQISSSANVNLTDFAVHPGDGMLYGIDNGSGWLYQFDLNTGNETFIGDTGEKGTFGAGYFDVDGNYYVSRNQDGKIYRIDLSSANAANINAGIVPAVEFVTNGPSSNQNDGARCANAPVIDEDTIIDFGDAPDSYQTLLVSNGPRHEFDGETWLGAAPPDGEIDGHLPPESDEDNEPTSKGVHFVTGLETGMIAKVLVEASTTGYLSAWIDWNADGDFTDDGEQVFTDQALDAGDNLLDVLVDIDAPTSTTWARFRFSQETNLSPFGGSTSGEVVDMAVTVLNDGATARYFPNETGYATLAYEDNWPYKADYDMNDAVIKYRITEILKDGKVIRSQIDGRLAAVGADYRSGFGIRLEGVAPSAINTAASFQNHNQASSELGLEGGRSEAIFIITDDLSSKANSNCRYYRTLLDCKEDETFSFRLNIELGSGIALSAWPDMPYDPFIFASPNQSRGASISDNPGRSWEVHLPDQAPTEAFDASTFKTGVDDSDPDSGKYFKTADNHPWALLITDDWTWPKEYTNLVTAYPKFAEYAASGGDNETNWFLAENAADNQCYEP